MKEVLLGTWEESAIAIDLARGVRQSVRGGSLKG